MTWRCAIKKIKLYIRLAQLLVVLTAIAIIGWRFEPVRDKVNSYRHDVQSNVGSVTGRKALDLGQKARRSFLRNNLERAVVEFESARGKKPAVLQDLVRDGLLEKADLVDEWGRELTVEMSADGVVVRSAGPDGKLHTRDDWVVGG